MCSNQRQNTFMCINHPMHTHPKKNYHLLQQLTKGQKIPAYHWKILSLQSDKITKRETIAHIAVAGLQIKVIGMSSDKPRSTLFKMSQKVGTTETWAQGLLRVYMNTPSSSSCSTPVLFSQFRVD